MFAASMMKRASSSSATSAASRRPLKAATVSVAPSMPRSRCVAKPQALFIKTYGSSSCRPSRYYRTPPSLGLGLARTLGMVDQVLAPERLRETASAVHPVEIRTLEDRYELQFDCPGGGCAAGKAPRAPRGVLPALPGMREEDVTVEVSPNRVLTIAGSRRAPPHGRDQQQEDSDQQPAATAGQGAPEKSPGPASNAAEGKAADQAAASKDGSNDDRAAWSVVYHFKRSFILPEDADVEGVAAALDRGVLTVCVPRRAVAAPQPRRVAVSVGGMKSR